MPGMPAIVVDGRRFELRQLCECFVITLCILLTQGGKFLDLPQLMNADRRLDIGEVVFESGCDNLVVPIPVFGVPVPGVLAYAVEAEDLHLVVKILVGGHDHSSLARCQILCGIEAEADCVAPIAGLGVSFPDGPSLVTGANCMSRILDNVETVLARQPPYGIHVARQSADVDRHDGACAPRQSPLDREWVDVPVFADVRKHWRGAHLEDRVDGRTEG